MWDDIFAVFREYMGSGLIIGWFLLSVGYLLLKEKQRHLRILFLYVPILVLLVFFNPLFARLLSVFADEEIYYRVLWLIPVAVVIGYTMVRIYGDLKGKKQKVFLAAGGILILISGSFIYANPHFQKAENIYHVPDKVVDICDAIVVEGREVMAVFPIEMLQYVRQYSPIICMPYGREITVARWGRRHELFDAVEADVIEVDKVVELARAESCHYVILSQEKEILGDFTKYEYELFDTIGGYLIYKDTTQNFTLEYR